MPLVPKDYFSIQEALDLVAERLPDEDAMTELLEALHRGVLAAWIIDRSGRRVEVPPTVWRSQSPLVNLSVRDGRVMFPRPSRYYSPPQIVSGRIHVDKRGLNQLLAPGDIMRAIEEEMRRRAAAGKLLPSMYKEAPALAEWAKQAIPERKTPAAKTIKNQLGYLHKILKDNPAGSGEPTP